VNSELLLLFLLLIPFHLLLCLLPINPFSNCISIITSSVKYNATLSSASYRLVQALNLVMPSS
jgi:hypothetical protein